MGKYKLGKYRLSVAGEKKLQNKPVVITDPEGNDLLDELVSTTIYHAAGNATIATLPTPGKDYEGFVYNMALGFETTEDFVEGAGKSYTAGTNVAVVNVGTAQSPSYKYDVLAGDYGQKQDKVVIVDARETHLDIIARDNQIFNNDPSVELDILSIDIPEGIDYGYISQINFTSCAADPVTGWSTEIKPPNIAIFEGDDVNSNGEFVPVEKKRYTLMFYTDGENILCIVKGTEIEMP